MIEFILFIIVFLAGAATGFGFRGMIARELRQVGEELKVEFAKLVNKELTK